MDRDKIGYGDQVQKNELRIQFVAIFQKIQTINEDSDVDREEIVDTVTKIRDEVALGESANLRKLERWIGFLEDMLPGAHTLVIDILQ